MELFVVILLFVIGSILNAAGKKRRDAERASETGAGEEPEGSDFLAEIRRTLEDLKAQQQGRQLPPRRGGPPAPRRAAPLRPASVPIADEEDVEEVESLEVEPEVRSLEEFRPRAERAVVDQDDEAEAVVARRIRWAEEHGRRKTMAEHREFDRRIRESAAAAAAVPGPVDPRARFRERFVWAEILGKPIALRDDQPPI